MPGAIKIQGELSLDGSGWESTLRKAAGLTNDFAEHNLGHLKAAIIGAFSIGAIEAFAHSMLEFGKDIKQLSEQFDISTDEVQKLQIAAIKTGLEFNNFGTALVKVGRARKEAAEGNAGLRKTFQDFGITLNDLQNPMLRNIDLIGKISEAIQNLELNPRQRSELDELLGTKGGEKLAASIRMINDIGGFSLISDKEAKKIEEVNIAFEQIIRNMKVAAIQGVGKFEGLKKLLEAAIVFPVAIALQPGGLQALTQLGPHLPFAGKGPNESPGIGGSKAADLYGPGPDIAKKNEPLFEDLELKKKQKELADLEEKHTLNMLTADERRVRLRLEMNRLLEEANMLTGQEAVDKRIEAEKKQLEIDSMDKPKHSRPVSDSLIKVGNFLGSGQNAIVSIGHKTNQLLTTANGHLQTIAKGMGGKQFHTGVPTT